MSTSTRREALRAFLHGAIQAAGTVILVSTVVPAAKADIVETGTDSPQDRADRLASADGEDITDNVENLCSFANGGFANGGGGGFRKGGFANGGGGFRNGGFANGGGGGGFRKGGFANGGGGGGFRNGGFANGGFRN